MEDNPILTDAEKLLKYAQEVSSMLILQQEYFTISKAARKDQASPDEAIKALNKSIAQESRVNKLTKKILNPQGQLL